MSVLKKTLIFALVLTMLMTVSVVTPFAAGANPFTDVPGGAWYYGDVSTAYNDGLINGKTATTFEPDSFMTYAEAVKLAACMHQKYVTGKVTLSNGSPWYQPYVEYCRSYGIISKDYEWNSSATRAGYMEIFASALPTQALKSINDVPNGSIPDVFDIPQSDAIYKLYRAGILQGVDDKHSCSPWSNIKRSEVAAILTRMMSEKARISFSMESGTKALAVTVDPSSYKSTSNAATFKASVTGGTSPYEYEWQWCDDDNAWTRFKSSCPVDYNGASSSKLNLILTNKARANGFQVRCLVTDAKDKTVKSKAVVISASKSALTIDTQPKDVLAAEDVATSFKVKASGGVTPYTYQWQVSENGYSRWTDLKGSSARTATYTGVFYEDCYVRCIVTDDEDNSVASDAAAVALRIEPLFITTEPQDQFIVAGDRADLSIKVTGGSGSYVYQWYSRGNGYSNWNKASTERAFTPRPDVSFEYVDYKCQVTDKFTNEIVDSDVARVTLIRLMDEDE